MEFVCELQEKVNTAVKRNYSNSLGLICFRCLAFLCKQIRPCRAVFVSEILQKREGENLLEEWKMRGRGVKRKDLSEMEELLVGRFRGWKVQSHATLEQHVSALTADHHNILKGAVFEPDDDDDEDGVHYLVRFPL
ncbi:hypothetical protein Baya_15423 [Bagarius yarrelli]|uniref:Uncharacterized protein n=1 Tax=Bagarius yarrelli TaxID=175774 RepID=A0A556VBK8_BAGYA|nr:hypothetical protein Baya_15423 [Bagarius yarrelli]